jgi:outer membrane protein TolC
MPVKRLDLTSPEGSAARPVLLLLAVALTAGVATAGAQVAEPANGLPPGVLAGGVPGPAPTGPVTITLQDAVERGLERNLAVVLGREQANAAAGAHKAVRSRVLPKLEATLAESRSVINLEAYGFPVAPGESPLIGPFNVFDARAGLAVPLVDLSGWADARAASYAAEAAGATLEDLRDQVVLAVSSLYLHASAAESRVVVAQAQVDTARALHEQAVDMKAAGVIAAIEVLRTEVQLAAERERLIVAENDAATSKLALARAIGLPLDADLMLLESLDDSPAPVIGADEAVRQALGQRSDYLSAQAALAAAEEAATAARNLAVPSLTMEADWGKVGPDVRGALTTYAVAARFVLPLYSGGFIHSRKLTATADVVGRRARLADLGARIEYEVRSALLDLEAADRRTRVARDAVRLAENQLDQARDRFAAGVADGVEVIQAQQAAATANDNEIASLLAENLARVRLARALGTAAEGSEDVSGGTR